MFLLLGEGVFDNKFIKWLWEVIKFKGSWYEVDYVKDWVYLIFIGELVIYC